MSSSYAQNKRSETVPQITSFRFPWDGYISIFNLGVILYFLYSPLDGNSALFGPARWVDANYGPKPAQYTMNAWYIVHVFETLYTFILCRRHRADFVTGTMYLIAAFICGFPIWIDIRKQVKAARDSMTKAK